MSILTIGSTNPNLSYILEKNPATIRDSGKAFRRELRKGVVYGWFSREDNTEFRLWFKDAEAQSSFAEGNSEEFEYLDRSRYGSPYIPVGIITNTLAQCSKTRHELDRGDYSNYVDTVIKVPNLRYLEQLASHYSGSALIEYTQLSNRYYKVLVSADSVFTALNVLQVVCLLQCFCDPETYVRLETAAVNKYVKVFNRADAPYYPRYLFQMKAISNKEMFASLKEDLQGPDMTLFYGDTRQQRFDAIKQQLTGGQCLIDIGCGELFQAMRLASKYESVIAVEADEDREENNRGKIEGRKVDNVVSLLSTANADWVEEASSMFTGADVLLTEVLEHIDYDDAEFLMDAILKTDFNKVVVTCPNKDFNVFYSLDEDAMRHSDHKWEPTFQEFCDQMVTLAADNNCEVICQGIGDTVNDQSTSVMATFTKIQEQV